MLVDKDEKLVSIIMPAYNCEKYIGKAIESVLGQTYLNWELVIVDDCSTDFTAEVITDYIRKEQRIKYYRLDKNSGAAVARNKAIEMSNGIYLAFLDSDDIWEINKLKKQIRLMQEKSATFSCTDYGKIDEKDNKSKIVIRCKKEYRYKDILRCCPGNSTVIYDASKLGKFYIPNIRRRNDFVMWLQVIKEAEIAYGYSEVLSFHRVREGSISYNKKQLLRYQWSVYRDIERLSIPYCIYLIFLKILDTLVLNLRLNRRTK